MSQDERELPAFRFRFFVFVGDGREEHRCAAVPYLETFFTHTITK